MWNRTAPRSPREFLRLESRLGVTGEAALARVRTQLLLLTPAPDDASPQTDARLTQVRRGRICA
jgi:hypothetical protein